MLRKVRKNSHSQDTHSEFISDEFLKKLTRPIQGLTGVTKTDFTALYSFPIKRWAEHHIIKAIEIHEMTLQPVEQALKRRRGLLLPTGADSETVFREQEQWTYGIFTAALLSLFEASVRMEMTSQILPISGLIWLERNGQLWELWQEYLKQQTSNVFTFIIEGKMPDKIITVVPKQKTETESAAAITPEPSAIESQTPETLLVVDDGDKEFDADDFWAWLKEAINSREMVLNQTESIVYRVELGVLIIIPKAIDCFLLQFKKENQDIDQQQTLLKSIKNQDELIRTSSGSRTHHYFLGKWEERILRSGFIVPADFLLDADTLYVVHPELLPDPITAG